MPTTFILQNHVLPLSDAIIPPEEAGTNCTPKAPAANNKVYMRVMIWYNIHLIEDFGRNQAISNPFGEAVLVSSYPNSVRVCNHDDSVR